MTIEEQVYDYYGIQPTECINLNTLANDSFMVTAPNGKYALKIYNPKSRITDEIRWELELINHLIKNDAPIAKPVKSNGGFITKIELNQQKRDAILFEWALGEKPKAREETYILLGQSAAKIHQASDIFKSLLPREVYDINELIIEQLTRMRKPLTQAGEWQRMNKLCNRLKQRIMSSNLDKGICHMDLTLDNVHVYHDLMTVFDLDSAGYCWRSLEPYGVLLGSVDYFQAWLQGYRNIRQFSNENESAVYVFAIVGEIRNVTWKLGLARSSRGKPLLNYTELPNVIDKWLNWEEKYL